jgi:hypothetical protein
MGQTEEAEKEEMIWGQEEEKADEKVFGALTPDREMSQTRKYF